MLGGLLLAPVLIEHLMYWWALAPVLIVHIRTSDVCLVGYYLPLF